MIQLIGEAGIGSEIGHYQIIEHDRLIKPDTELMKAFLAENKAPKESLRSPLESKLIFKIRFRSHPGVLGILPNSHVSVLTGEQRVGSQTLVLGQTQRNAAHHL
jgi:hypothetical protein